MMKAVEAAPRVEAKVAPGAILRKCACQGSCGPCAHDAEKERGLVQRQAAAGAQARSGAAGRDVATSIHTIARQSGAALPAATRTTMESRFGQRDFSRVKVHTGPEVDTVARDISADAFTVGSDVFFASGKYDPGSPQGQRLLAHELTHVVQQGNATALPAQLELGSPSASAEAEADRVADDVVSGRPVGALGASVSGPVIRRAAVGSRGLNNASCTTQGGTWDNTLKVCRIVDPTTLAIRAIYGPQHPFMIPAKKATPNNEVETLDRFREAADHARLRTIHTGRSSGVWLSWGRVRGRPGTFATDTTFPDGSGETFNQACSPDHVVDLQLNGPDDGNNLRLLRQARNSQLGSEVQGVVSRDVRAVFNEYPTTRGYVEYTRAELDGTPVADACATQDVTRTGSAAAAAAAQPQIDFKIGATGRIGQILYEEASTPQRDVHRRSFFAIPGLHLITYDKPPAPADDPLVARLSAKTEALPLRNKNLRIGLLVDKTTRQVRMQSAQTSQAVGQQSLGVSTAGPPLQFLFPFLSEASLGTGLAPSGLVAEGEFAPTLPLLNAARVRLRVENERLDGGVAIPAETLQRAFAHVPGLRVDRADLQIGVADGAFSATGGLGFAYGRFATGSIEAHLSNAQGFSATGRVDLHIPGIDDAHGEVWVRQGRLGGHLVIAASKLPFRQFVRDANLRVDVEDGRLSGTGIVNLNIPGTRDARLTFTADSLGNYSLAGAATLAIPGVRDPRVELRYENGVLSGRGSAGFTIPGLESATIELLYTNGALTGSANAAFRRGKLAGTLHATLNARHRLSGGGDLEYELAPGLVAIAGVEIDENGRTHVRGELRMPDPIQLFAERAYNKQLFALNLDIPIFGISVGSHSVGIIATIGAEINARASIGPGQIRRPRILVAFDVENPASSASFAASAELYVPASAEIAVVIRGGIGVSLLIVRATGGIQATASAGLFGALSVPLELRYAQSRFTVDGRAELFAEPKLRFALDAFARVDLDLLLTSINLYEKTWRLASFEWGSNYRVGVRFPVHYVFGEPFALSLDRLEFIAPPVDVRSAMRSLLTR